MFIFKEEDNLYDWISCLLDQVVYFGPFPNQLMMNRLLSNKFNVIVNLTTDGEEPPYHITYPPGMNKEVEYIHYPIKDNGHPHDIASYVRLIIRLKYLYLNGKRIYIHCRGGHGRSSMTCVSLIYILFPCQFYEAISYVNECHNKRVNLRSKWKKRRSPFNPDQYHFLSKIHKNIYININGENKYYNWLMNDDIRVSLANVICSEIDDNDNNNNNDKNIAGGNSMAVVTDAANTTTDTP